MTLHHFSDASEEVYGQVSYLRLVNTENKIHCVVVMGKSRVAPGKRVSIPRLELTAATLSVKMSKLNEKNFSTASTRNISGSTVKWCLDAYRMNQRDSKYLWQTGSRSLKNILMWVSDSM